MHADIHHYRAFGLRIESHVELPELNPVDGELEHGNTLQIDYGAVPAALPRGVRLRSGIELNEDSALVNIAGVAAFCLRGGVHVTIEPAAGANSATIRKSLLGVVLGVLFVQRGIFAMHASSVDLNGCGVAFIGPSGSGKSTLAAYLNRKGYPLIADDACIVDRTETGMQTRHGVAQIKLWHESLNAIEPTATALPSVYSGREKHYLPAAVPKTAPSRPVPLCALYLIEPVESGAATDIVPIMGLAALEVIRQNVHARRLHCHLNGDHYFLLRCIAIQRNLPVYSLRMPRGFNRLADVNERLESHWKTAAARARVA